MNQLPEAEQDAALIHLLVERSKKKEDMKMSDKILFIAVLLIQQDIVMRLTFGVKVT